jgi:type I restriction enzyme M protein
LSNTNYANFIWSIADLLRGSYRPHQYGSIVLPFTILRRLDAVLAETKAEVLAEYEKSKDGGIPLTVLLPRKSKHAFYNTSKYDFQKLTGDAENVRDNLLDYVRGFSDNVRDIFEKYKLEERIEELDEHDVLFLITQQFAAIDLHPGNVSNSEMGLIFEELIRKFAESSNETAGEHFTPREVIHLMVDILFAPDDSDLDKANIVRSIYDPTAGTGGMLSVADEYLRELNPDATLTLAGQEINPESYAICKADMVIKGQDVGSIVLGDTLTDDGHKEKTFNYCLSNPPFGVDWKKAQGAVEKEFREQGFEGRFGPGLPKVSDGSLLFLLHLVKKMRPVHDGGGRVAIVLNGSPLFSGGAGSGESEIRRYLMEHDLLESIIALPTEMFYNTGISTYVWVLTNRKADERKGKVQLIDGSGFFRKMRRPIGSKRNELKREDIARIVKLYGDFEDSDSKFSKVFSYSDFAYRTITVERPLRLNFEVSPKRLDEAMIAKTVSRLPDVDRIRLRDTLALLAPLGRWSDRDEFTQAVRRNLKTSGVPVSGVVLKSVVAGLSARDESAEPCVDSKGNIEPDPELRDTENVPMADDIHEYFDREVKPHSPDAWIDVSKTKIGYEIPFTRHFFRYRAPRGLAEINTELAEQMATARELDGLVLRDFDRAHNVYKESGSECFGRIPAHWSMERLGRHFVERKETVSDEEYQPLSVTKDGIVPQLDSAAKSDNRDNRKRVAKGDFVINSRSDRRGSSGVSDRDGSVSVISTVIQPIDLDRRFVHHQLRSVPFQEEYYRFGSGIVADLWSTRYSSMKNIKLPIPPIEEQEAIGEALDVIELQIQSHERIVKLLKERRDSLGAAAVTGRVDMLNAIPLSIGLGQ